MSKLSKLWHTTIDFLCDFLEEELDPLTEKQKRFIAICELAKLDEQMKDYASHPLGRKKKTRIDLAKTFVAKAVHNFPTTSILIEHLKGCKNLRRLCGWEYAYQIPSESTFSRAFAEFAKGNLGEVLHKAMVKNYCGKKLAGHISRDSTAIKAREKAAKKPAKKSKPKHKRGRPRKDEKRESKSPKRLELQPKRSLDENLADLPTDCNWGQKRNSQGKTESWKGYKLHIDCIDGDIPISAVLTSASLHDSQAAIPLAQMSNERVTNLYDLMDAAYCAAGITNFSKSLGHVPIIDENPRRGVKKEIISATKQRYKERSSVERVNSYLKDNYGGHHVRVRGHAKVKLHLMFGVISICATQIFRLLE